MKQFALLSLFLIFSFSAYAEELVPKGIWFLGNGSYYPTSAVVVDKTRRKLSLWGKGEENKIIKIKEYISDQGKNDGDKLYVGDKRTPEGVYFFKQMLQGKNLPFELYGVRAFTTDYPNLFDKRMGKTGSGIWLHAIPDSESLERGSRGCVVIRNKSIVDLSDDIVLDKTAFMVFPEVEYISSDQFLEQRKEIAAFLKSWVQAWQNKDFANYINLYSNNFKADKKNLKQWGIYKKALNDTYQSISVALSDPVVYEVDGKIIVRSLQHYKSDQLEDFGEKTLYLEREGNHIKIISEQWQEVPQNIVLAEINTSSILRSSQFTSAVANPVVSQNKN